MLYSLVSSTFLLYGLLTVSRAAPSEWGVKCFVTKVLENSLSRMVEVSSFDIRLDKISFSKIFRIDGRFKGSLINISASKSLRSYE